MSGPGCAGGTTIRHSAAATNASAGRRLERLIGPAAVRRIVRLVKKNPGRTVTPAAVKKKHAKQAKG